MPILWNNVDLADLRHGTDALTILDEIARTGFEGTQLGIGFPEGAALRDALAERRLRLAEVYLSIPATVDGPTPDAIAIGRERLRLLHDGGGEVLVIALDLSPGREETRRAGERARHPAPDRRGLGRAHRNGPRPRGRGRRGGPSGGLPPPRPGRSSRRRPRSSDWPPASIPALVGICLDVGHYTVGGGDPVAALRELGDRVTHIHLKDVDPHVLDASAQRGDRWLRCRDPGPPLHRARGGRCSTSTASSPPRPAATTTAG